MKRVVSGIFWLAVFLVAGGFAGRYFPFLAGHGRFAGPAGGLVVFVLAAWLALLPGVRPPRTARWGLVQGFWLIAGFMLTQLGGAVLCSLIITGFTWFAVTRLHMMGPAGAASPLAVLMAGYLSATLWVLWYIGRLGPARVRDGGLTGIAWRPASWRGYATAVAAAAAIIVVVVVIVHILPPDMGRVSNMPSAKLFSAPGWPVAVLLVLAVFIAPPVEEYVFRGGVFAALAGRFSPLWAGVITTLLFMAVHAPEKIYYPAGFIDVGLMAAAAAWLRVKFGSIRPGILLHVLYNFGLLFAAGTLG
jgi:membrane protease YdiL (CAAX protease family)